MEIIDAGCAFGSLEARPASGTGRRASRGGWPDDDQSAQPRSRFRFRSVTTTGRLQRIHSTVHSNGSRSSWAIYLLACFIRSAVKQAWPPDQAEQASRRQSFPSPATALSWTTRSRATLLLHPPAAAQRCPVPVSQSAGLSGCVERKACDNRFSHHPFFIFFLVPCALHLSMLYSSQVTHH